MNPNVIFAGLLGAITWNIITWAFGIPSSSSHALIGGYAGAAMGRAGLAAITWGSKWVLTLSFIVQQDALGTANAVLAAAAWTSGDAFLAMNADNLYPVPALTALALLDEPGFA